MVAMQEEAARRINAHLPRHIRLAEVTLARLAAEDLTRQINAGRALEESLATGSSVEPAIAEWCEESVRLLDGFIGEPPPSFGGGLWVVQWGFRSLIQDVGNCVNPEFPDQTALARAHLSIGLEYLEAVLERVPDYAKASRRTSPEPRVSFSFNGGSFHGVQFAAQIANIESTIAGVAQQSGSEVADALKGLQQAVLSQDGLEDSQRQVLLDNVEYLATAANTQPQQRNRGLITSVLLALSTAAASGDQLQRAMDTWGSVLQGLLP